VHTSHRPRQLSRFGVLTALLLAAVLALFLSTVQSASASTYSVNRLRYSTGSSTQMIVVTSGGYGTSYATLETFYKDRYGHWQRAFAPMAARVGYNGFAPPGAKREGDGRSPTGRYGVGPFMWGGNYNPGVHYPYRKLVFGDWWDEHTGSPTYNSWQYYPSYYPPFASGSEKLWQTLPAYNYAVTIGYNTYRPVQGAGSGIFLHVGTGGATAGCISLSTQNVLNVMRWLNPTAHPQVAEGPSSVILY